MPNNILELKSISGALVPPMRVPITNTSSVSFDGANDAMKTFVNVHNPTGNGVSLATSGFTVAAWVKCDKFFTDGVYTQVGATQYENTFFGAYIGHGAYDNLIFGTKGAKWNWAFGQMNSTNNGYYNTARQPHHFMTAGTWYHVALTFTNTHSSIFGSGENFEGTQLNAGTPRIYLNGVLSSGTVDVVGTDEFLTAHWPHDNIGSGNEMGAMHWNRSQAVTLNGAITSTSTTIAVNPFPIVGAPRVGEFNVSIQATTDSHRVLTIGTEQILVTANGGYDASSGATDFTVATNGRGHNGTTAQAHSDDALVIGFASLAIGTRERWNWTGLGAAYNMDGHMDEMAIYNTPLSAAEVAAMTASGTKVQSLNIYGKPANLIAWYRMGDGTEAGSGTTIYNTATTPATGSLETQLQNGASIVSVTP